MLLNACLLAHGLPVVVVNYADRERYLYCLSESNKGDLSPIVEFFIECLEQQLDYFTAGEVPEILMNNSEGAPPIAHNYTPKPETGIIDQSTLQINIELADDPLSAVMKEKLLEHEKFMQAEYEAWNQSFLHVFSELKAIVESFNNT